MCLILLKTDTFFLEGEIHICYLGLANSPPLSQLNPTIFVYKKLDSHPRVTIQLTYRHRGWDLFYLLLNIMMFYLN